MQNPKAKFRTVAFFFQWFTGVLAVSGVIVGHKWMHVGRKEDCPLSNFDERLIRHVLVNGLPRDHLVLAVTSDSSELHQKAQSGVKSTSHA